MIRVVWGAEAQVGGVVWQKLGSLPAALECYVEMIHDRDGICTYVYMAGFLEAHHPTRDVIQQQQTTPALVFIPAPFRHQTERRVTEGQVPFFPQVPLL